ncbi:MAG: anthranilate synthase component I family protein [Candidatus Methylacidiphilales bacterium]|nr:anthranilate synthase component I family protein [Candidatus Methylacidiphilales bacterium]
MNPPPTAVIVRDGMPGTAYFFGAADSTLVGGPGDHGLLAEGLARRRASCPPADTVHPPGAWVGAFRYDGSFVFHDCPHVRVGTCDELWPEQMTAAADQSGLVHPWMETLDRHGYRAVVNAAKEHIRAGDIYQVNLTRRFWQPSAGDNAYELFRHLWSVTEAPLSAFLSLPGGALCSASPELFLSIQGRQATTRPIKGTRPRERDPMRDAQNAYELVSSPKEQAELVMITDLERNDLGRICEYGSVEVAELVKREAFSHVFHLVSTVTGRLRSGIGPVEAVAACFPGGSITGAPKKRAMEIISALETEPRGWYTGAMGYFGYDGSAQFNIAIRTLVLEEGVLHFHTGSGITADSDPGQEFDETRHKASALLQAVAQYRSSHMAGVTT